MSTSTEKTSAQIQHEIEADRQRIGERIDAIQERMSPGQLIDEVLTYAKGSGGGEYLSNLGHAMKANPLPVALMGISLAWLMAEKAKSATPYDASPSGSEDYPLYTVEGSVRRIGPPEYRDGARFSHFTDDRGNRWKALTDDAGHRAGHFMDEAGKTYRGFADASGKQIEHIFDETGAAIDAASGWASTTWAQAKDVAGRIGGRASAAMGSLSETSASAGTMVKDRATDLNEAILRHFRDQPLVGGALAFAVGAAIGAALPSTDPEDALLGEAADSAKDAATSKAADLVEEGKEIATEALEKTVTVAADIHDAARERVVEELGASREENKSSY